MYPVANVHARRATSVESWWATAPRRQRRAGARWWWRTCTRTAATWQQQWEEINSSCGVVPFDE